MANFGIAIANGDDFAFAIVVGDLVDVAVFLGFFANAKEFFLIDIMGFFGLDAVIGHIAHGKAPVFGIAGATDAQNLLAHRAGARRSGEVSFVFVDPIGDLFDIDGRGFMLDGLFDGDDVHADASAARWDHLG